MGVSGFDVDVDGIRRMPEMSLGSVIKETRQLTGNQALPLAA